MKTTTIRVSTPTHQRITKQAKWGEPLEDVIIRLLNQKESLKTFYDKLMAFENQLIADCGQGKSFEAGNYAGVVANLRKDLEPLLS